MSGGVPRKGDLPPWGQIMPLLGVGVTRQSVSEDQGPLPGRQAGEGSFDPHPALERRAPGGVAIAEGRVTADSALILGGGDVGD